MPVRKKGGGRSVERKQNGKLQEARCSRCKKVIGKGCRCDQPQN